jgi:hypothetical protein
MRAEYRFDYRNARANRFAARMSRAPLVVLVDSDLAEVFTTPKSVNQALCTLIRALPRKTKRKVVVD